MKASDAFKDLMENDTPSNKALDVLEKGEEVPEAILEAMDSTLTAIAPTAIERSIIEKTLQGISIPQVSYSLGIPEGHIRTFLRNPKIKTRDDKTTHCNPPQTAHQGFLVSWLGCSINPNLCCIFVQTCGLGGCSGREEPNSFR